jgi:type I restriction enzyme, S subunit
MAKKDTSKATPRLRFPEFRGAEGWEAERMEELYSFMRNNILSRDKLNYESGAVKNIHYGDIHTKFSVLFDITKERVPYINNTEELPDINSGDYCVEGDIIFADASEDMDDVGKSIEIVRLSRERLLSGQHTILARRKYNTLIVGFGGHLFRSGYIRSQIQKEAQGTKVYAISSTRLANIKISYPSDKKEQRKIADCLTSLDELIVAQGRKVEALKAHKRGLMQELFPREGETIPRLRFPEFCDGPEWDLVSLGKLLIGKPEYGVNAPAVPFSAKLPTYLRITDIDDDGHFIAVGRASVNIEATDENYLKEGDIVLARTGASVGKSYRYRKEDGRLVFAGFLIRIRPDKKKILTTLLSSFLATQQYWDWVRVMSARSGQPGINGNEYATLSVPIPPPGTGDDELAEQQRIASCLSSLDDLIAAESNKLEALKTHKKGLMQQLFPTMLEES